MIVYLHFRLFGYQFHCFPLFLFMWLNRQWYFHNATDYKPNQSLLSLHFVIKPLKSFLQSQNSNWVSSYYFMHQLIKWFPVRLKSEKLKSYNKSKLLFANLGNWNQHKRFWNGCGWKFSIEGTQHSQLVFDTIDDFCHTNTFWLVATIYLAIVSLDPGDATL